MFVLLLLLKNTMHCAEEYAFLLQNWLGATSNSSWQSTTGTVWKVGGREGKANSTRKPPSPTSPLLQSVPTLRAHSLLLLSLLFMELGCTPMKNGRRENKVTVAAFGKCEIGRKSASFEAEVEAAFFTLDRTFSACTRTYVRAPSRPYIAC